MTIQSSPKKWTLISSSSPGDLESLTMTLGHVEFCQKMTWGRVGDPGTSENQDDFQVQDTRWRVYTGEFLHWGCFCTITQNPGFSAYTQHWVLYTWDELIMSISQVGKPLHEFEEDLFEEDIKQTYLISSRFFIVQNLLKSRRLWSQPEEVGFCVKRSHGEIYNKLAAILPIFF